jgi:transposase
VTRHACAAAAVVLAESAAGALLQLQVDAAMGIDTNSPSSIPSVPSPSLIPLTTKECITNAAAADSKRAGLAALACEDIRIALRTAMAVQGDPALLPPPLIRNWLAERYIHSRIVVDQHTAAAVLFEAYSQSRVLIVRNFPGALPPAYTSVSAVLNNPPPQEERLYSYNHHGSHVHYFLRNRFTDTPETQQALEWWRPVNLLPDTGNLGNVSSGTLWSFISRRAKTLLHIDDADGITTQWVGKKLWVVVKVEEAAKQEIKPLLEDAMREPTPRVHRLTAWQQCDSFQWCVLNEGDTILTPRDRLHAVCCIGDVDAVGSGIYCWLNGTPPLPERLRGPRPSKKRQRTPSPALPPAPRQSGLLPIAQRAWDVASSSRVPPVARIVAATLIDAGQTLNTAADKAGVSCSSVQRWSKRLRSVASADDAPRSGRPRVTDALADAAIVRASELDHFKTTKAIKGQLVLNVSDNTVNRRLDAAGLPSCIAAQKRHYTPEQIQARLSFARGYQSWTAEQWEHLIISDEKTFEGAGRERQQRVRRPKGHRFDAAYTKHRKIYAPSCHIFACFCGRGPGYCKIYYGKLDGKSLRKLLDDTIVQTAADYYDLDHGEQWWFLHDNSPPFTSSEVQTWLHNHGISVIDFPPHSPDLNPIENLWPRVAALMDKLHPTSSEATADAFIQCWPEVPLDLFTDYAQSMPARIQAVIDANGNATKF